MENFQSLLKNQLLNAKRIAIFGIGSEIRADDVVGVLVAENLQKNPPKGKNYEFKVFIGGTAPENFTGDIKKFNPTHLIIIDAADLGKDPGEIALINPEEIGGTSFSTHRMPTKMLAEYIKQYINCEVIIIGIQPKVLNFGEPVSEELVSAAARLSALLKNSLEFLT